MTAIAQLKGSDKGVVEVGEGTFEKVLREASRVVSANKEHINFIIVFK